MAGVMETQATPEPPEPLEPPAAPLPGLTRKEAIWLSCRRKTCCHGPIVVPTGRDVWRIARALDTSPETFLLVFPTPQPRRDAFALDHSDRRFRIALGKGPSRRKSSPRPCLFLLRTRSGDHRCGLGALRPMVCRAFLVHETDGLLSLQGEEACACRTWSLTDVDIVEEGALVHARQLAADEYCRVVERWNAIVGAAPEAVTFTLGDYFAYLMQTYDRLMEPGGVPAPAVEMDGSPAPAAEGAP
jgi:hypothetical protein